MLFQARGARPWRASRQRASNGVSDGYVGESVALSWRHGSDEPRLSFDRVNISRQQLLRRITDQVLVDLLFRLLIGLR